jgi:hypothetical protein
MTTIDFQVDAGRFLAAQRSYLRRLALCPPLLPAVAGVQIVVDRVDVGPSSLRHDEPATFDVFYVQRGDVVGETDAASGFRTVLAQQLTLQLTTDAQIRANPNADPPLLAWPVTVLYELSAFPFFEDCCLRAAPLAVEFGPPPALPVAIPPAIVAMLESFVSEQLRILAPSGTIKLGLDALKLPTEFLNAGLTVDSTGSTLAIRVQIRASQDLQWAQWTNFYRGFIVDRREGRDWALFVPAAYITHSITHQLWQNLPKNDDLEAYPGAAYVPLPGTARFDVDVLLIYHLVEVDELDLDITVSAQPRVQLDLSVDLVNRLSAQLEFAGLVNPVGALSTLAVAIVDAFGIPARAFLYRLVGSAIVDALAGQPGLAVTQPTPSTVRVDRDVVLPGVAGVAFANITDMLAQADGIALVGAFTVAEATNTAVQVLGVAQFAKHVPDISCGAASMALIALFGQDPTRFGILKAGVSLGNAGTAPLHLCTAPVLQRLDGPVQPANVHVDEVGLPIDISIDIGPPTPAYYAAPFPIELMVRTNGGTRFIRFDPPPVVTQEDLDHMQAGVLVKLGDCQQLLDPWFKLHGGYNPHWSPRPPEEGFDVLHHWEVVVAGLPMDERIELRGRDGLALAIAPGRGRGRAARVSVVVDPAREGEDLSIVRVGAAHEGEPPGHEQDMGRGLEVRQTDLIVLGEIPLMAPSHALGIVELTEGPTVVALLEDRVEAFDVRAGSAAGAIASWPGRFSGLLRSPRGTLLFGAEGVSHLDARGVLSRTSIREPILDAASSPDGVQLVTMDSVLRLAPDLSVSARTDRAQLTGIASLSTRLLLAHALGVEDGPRWMALDNDRTRTPKAARRLERAPGLGRQAILATWADGATGLLQERDGTVVEVARYVARPLLAGAVRLGSRLVFAAPNSDCLRVIGIGRRVVR